MPSGVVPRALEYVVLLFTFSLASTFAWWLGATVARAEYRRLLSALACSMRFFFYSICLLCILVAVQAFGWGPSDPRDDVMGRIHIAGSVLISVPCALRAFRVKGGRLVAVVAVAWSVLALSLWAGARLGPGFREMLVELPRHLARG